MSSEIKPFYSKTNILITGGTGLLGKLIIQKLLRTCDDISGIYLIVRGKKGKSAAERVDEGFNEAVFDKLKKENPEFSKKIHVVEGDCSLVGLGLNQPSRKLLIDKINIIFHCAATLSMDAKMKDAVKTNVRGLSELLDLCHEMRYLKSMVFVSTAYSNCTQYVIEERFYEAPIQAATLMKLTDEVEEKVLDNVTPGLIGKWPNTYCYTKAIAESLFYNKAGSLPVGVFRPSIVMPTHSDPVPGWTSNVYGPVGAMLASGLGLLRVFYCIPHQKFDSVPADFCVNALICTAWEIHQKKQNNEKSPEQQIPVYNYSAGPDKNLTVPQLMNNSYGYEYPFRNILWITTVTLTDNLFFYNFLWILLHTIPGYLIDIYFFMTGQKMRVIKAYQKLSKYCDVLTFFLIQSWDIVNKNSYRLWDRLSETDRELFPFDMNAVEFKKYIQNTCLGMKLYILKENLDNAEAEKKHYQRLLTIHKTIKFVSVLLALTACYKITSLSFSLLHCFIHY